MDARVHEHHSWWYTHGATGRIDPELLAPDPNQPRKFMIQSELDELTESIRTSGVRESLTVSPLSAMPWIKLGEEQRDGAEFLIVSGHRRRAAALRANLTDVPVVVKIYDNERQHREDAALLNGPRTNLSPLEEGIEIHRRREIGETMESIASSFGKSVQWATSRHSLTHLDPSIQALLDPNRGRDVLPIVIATDLGGVGIPSRERLEEFFDEHDLDESISEAASPDDLRFAYQRALLAVIQERSMNATAARDFILQSKHIHGAMRRDTDRRSPRKRLIMLRRYLKHAKENLVAGWEQPAYAHVLRNLELADAETLVVASKEALDSFQSVVHKLQNALDEKQKRLQYTTPQLMQVSQVRHLTGADAAAHYASIREAEKISALEQVASFTPVKDATYLDHALNRYVTGTISDPKEFIRIWEAGEFKWQDRRERKPEHFPTLEEVQALLSP